MAYEMIRKYAYALAVPVCAGLYFLSGSACGSRLTVLNQSGEPISSLRIGTPGEKAEESQNLAASASLELSFSGFTAGNYSVEVVFAGGSIRDTLGYLDPRAAFQDTLAIRPESEKPRLVMAQNTLPCREGFHLRAFIRRALHNL